MVTTATSCAVAPPPSADFNPNPTRFPLVEAQSAVRVLTASELHSLHQSFISTPLPSHSLFPWLHGVNGTDPHQNLIFGLDGSQALPLPDHRGLILVHASDDAKGRLVGSVGLAEILEPSSRVHATMVPESADSSFSSSCASPPPRAMLDSFIRVPGEGINIRNFKIQVARYATISDIIVYSEHAHDPEAVQVAEQIAGAQQKFWQDQHNQSQDKDQSQLQSTPPSKRPRFSTFVVSDGFETIEQLHPDLIATNSAGASTANKVDFWEQEREQMTLLTRASEIAPGLWLGNNSDLPAAGTDATNGDLATPSTPGTAFTSYFFSTFQASPPSTPIPDNSAVAGLAHANKGSSQIPSTPPSDYPPLTPPSHTSQTAFQPSICIECRAGGTIPTTTLLENIKQSLKSYAAPLELKDLVHLECTGSLTTNAFPTPFPPSTSSTSNFNPPGFEDAAIVNTNRRALASNMTRGLLRSHNSLRAQIVHLLEMVYFVHAVVHGEHHHQVLVHCVDGYTDTSLFALAYLMYNFRLTLAEAYVKLQTDLGRSFFVYTNDALIMLQVEERIWERIAIEDQKERITASAAAFKASGAASSPSTPLVTGPIPTPWTQDGTHASSNNAMYRPFVTNEHVENFGWFYHPEFEGSFPSRILPFLYLGNLAHASNPGLLKALGIKYVLSVGEETAWDNSKQTVNGFFSVKLVDEMYDNGIDSLWTHLEDCVDFVDEARKTNTRILIHCRVGVSRSATIVIAYLMAHYKLSLVDAYLMVRARRLSVIIQPNLRFMYELLQWDQQLRGRFDSLGWTGIAREIHSLNMCYIG